ncbi:MAG: hypothetical protein MK078_18165 [Crocinitomicaceae bacterium]|nr:hypothetical protein [Crocinitomicaceae bacterium]
MKRGILLLLCFVSFTGISQAHLNFEKNNSLGSDVTMRGVGGSFQYYFRTGKKNLPGISFGAIREQDITRNQTFLSVPVNLHLRHYFLGSHDCFAGVYIEGSAGANFQMQGILDSDFSNTTLIQGAGGIGVQLLRKVDVNLRVGRNFSPDLQYNYVGLRAGIRL